MNFDGNGKGSGRRKSQISEAEMNRRWELAFGKKNKNDKESNCTNHPLAPKSSQGAPITDP